MSEDHSNPEAAPIFEGRATAIDKENALSMLEALRHPAIVYVQEDGTCLIQGWCDRLTSNHRFFKQFEGPVPENYLERIVLKPKIKTTMA